MTKLKVLNKLWPKEWCTIKLYFCKIYSQDGLTSNDIIIALSKPNEEIIDPKLYPQNSSIQRNKRCAKILSNEEVTTILLKYGMSVKKVRPTKVATEPKFDLLKLTFDRLKQRPKVSKIDLDTPIQYPTTQIEFQRLYYYFNGQI